MTHLPERTCLGCRRKGGKGEFLRLVRNADGAFDVDVRGKGPGRGAYVCLNLECIRRAVNAKTLTRAFRLTSAPAPAQLNACKETLEAFLERQPKIEPNLQGALDV